MERRVSSIILTVDYLSRLIFSPLLLVDLLFFTFLVCILTFVLHRCSYFCNRRTINSLWWWWWWWWWLWQNTWFVRTSSSTLFWPTTACVRASPRSRRYFYTRRVARQYFVRRCFLRLLDLIFHNVYVARCLRSSMITYLQISCGGDIILKIGLYFILQSYGRED